MRTIRHFKIKNKLIAIILSITILILAVAFTGIVIFNKILLETSFKHETKTICNLVSNYMISVLSFGDSKEGQKELIKFLPGLPTIKNVWIYDHEGLLFASWNQPPYELEKPEIIDIPSIVFKDNFLHLSQDIRYKKNYVPCRRSPDTHNR